jgi:hypothetical protein
VERMTADILGDEADAAAFARDPEARDPGAR